MCSKELNLNISYFNIDCKELKVMRIGIVHVGSGVILMSTAYEQEHDKSNYVSQFYFSQFGSFSQSIDVGIEN